VKEGRGIHDKRIWVAVDGIKGYTTAYIAAENERVKGTELEGENGTRGMGCSLHEYRNYPTP